MPGRPPTTSPDITALEVLMSEISEDCYAAGWMNDLEYDLWALVVGDRDSYGMLCSREHLAGRIEALRKLSAAAGVWLRWEGEAGPRSGPRPVPLSEWLRVYDERK